MNSLKQSKYEFVYDMYKERGVDPKYVIVFNSIEQQGMLLRILNKREQVMYQKCDLFVNETGLFLLKIMSIDSLQQGLDLVENFLRAIGVIMGKKGSAFVSA